MGAMRERMKVEDLTEVEQHLRQERTRAGMNQRKLAERASLS
jgi:hypothetical protein